MSRSYFALLAFLMIPSACSGGSDDEDSGDCSCSCACCVSIGNCETPSDIAASDSSDCLDKCEARCGQNFSQSYECS